MIELLGWFCQRLECIVCRNIIRQGLKKIPAPPRDPRGLKRTISLADCPMSGLALLGLKFPSLLQFDQGIEDEVVSHNLRTLYGVERAPSDAYMREKLDEVDPESIRATF